MSIDPNKLFFPQRAIRQDNQAFFAGRRDQLLQACERVSRDGFSSVVYGDRGVGKTSFGWQLLELLDGNTSIFTSADHPTAKNILYNLPPAKCIWFQCQDYMQNIEGVLLSLLRESVRDHSFASEFSGLYQNNELNDTLQRKYSINLGIVSTEFLFKKDDKPPTELSPLVSDLTVTQKSKVQDLFKDVIDYCKKIYPDESIVIFLDEFDSLPDRNGVGSLVKSIDDARFVIIGIADNIDEIIKDHESASRKLEGSKFRIPRFKSEEINFIFDKAEQVAENQIVFEPKFRERVAFLSYGYPYVVQQLGFFATKIALASERGHERPLQVTANFLGDTVDRLFEDKRESTLFRPLIEILSGNAHAKKEILKHIANRPDYDNIQSIRDAIGGRLKRHVDANIESLVKLKVLKSTDNSRLRFANPEARILTLIHFASEQK